MAKKTTPTKSESYFGGGSFDYMGPREILPDTKILNVEISFEDALKIHLAMGECLSKLNSYKRNARPKRVMTFAIHLDSNTVTIHDSQQKRDVPT